MHSIRRRAHRLAWEEAEGTTSSFNPFRRSTHERRPEDTRSNGLLQARRRTLNHSIERSHSPGSLEHIARSRTEPAPASDPPAQSPVEHDQIEKINSSGGSTHEVLEPEQRSEDVAGNVELGQAMGHARKARRSIIAQVLLFPPHLLAKLGSRIYEFCSNTIRTFKKSREECPIRYQIRKIFFNSWLHLLLVLIPAGMAVKYTRINPVAIFFLNFAAMIPSIMIMSFAVENILMYVGELLGGLISTTFSNAAQLITSVLLLRSHQVEVLRTSLVGAILSNLLLMPGLCFACGGFNRLEQFFNITVAQTTGEMLLLAILSLVIPTAGRILTETTAEGTVKQSRGTAIILLVCYSLFMFFQLKTHTDMYHEPSQKVPKKKSEKQQQREMDNAKIMAQSSVANNIEDIEDEKDEEDVPDLPLLSALLTLAIFTTLLTFNTLFATDSIQALLERLDISKPFLGLVVLPIISNDPTTLIVAIKDQQDLMLSLTLGRCVQIALLVIPFSVLLAWMIGVDEMSLSFNGFETLIMLAAVLVVNYVVQDGKSNWLIGALLVASYLIISVSAYYIP